MHSEQRQRTRELLRSRGIDHALFSDTDSITWLTGFAAPRQLGTNLFSGGPPLLWYDEGQFTLVVLDGVAGFVAGLADVDDCHVESYPGYTIEAPIESGRNLQATLRTLLAGSAGGGQVGVETMSLPVGLQTLLAEAGFDDPILLNNSLTPLRMIKSAEELGKLKHAFELAAAGHAAARQSVRAGLREIDIWNNIHAAIQRRAGERVALVRRCCVPAAPKISVQYSNLWTHRSSASTRRTTLTMRSGLPCFTKDFHSFVDKLIEG